MVIGIIAYKSMDDYIFFAWGKDKNGIGRRLDYFERIGYSATYEDLGSIAKNVIKYSGENYFIENPDNIGNTCENATGIKIWSKFFKKYFCVSIKLDTISGFVVSPILKVQKYRTYMNTKDRYYPVYELPLDCTDEKLGEKIAESFTFAENS